MSKKLTGKKIAILATNGFEQSELLEPMHAVQEQGATTEVVSLEDGEIKAWKDGNWGTSVKVDKTLKNTSPDNYDGLIIPGGVMNPDTLRNSEEAVSFVKGFFNEGKQKPVAAICHGPWMLAEADVIKGRVLTSYSSIKTDLKNAGADWTDREVVVDKGLVTSRHPGDLAAFCSKTIEEMCEGTHSR